MTYIAEKHRAFLVGGSVRDYLLGKMPDDDDIVVMDDPRKAALRLAKQVSGSFVELGKADMTVFRVVSGTHIFDISPPKGLSLEEDLSRRDFTINAMAMDMSSDALIDPLNGLDDLKRKVVRMVSEQSFTDDPLRLLRAFRMSAMLNFRIEEKTLDAIRRYADMIRQSAGERIRAELFKILQTPDAHSVISQMAEHRLLFEIFPELTALKGCEQNRHHAFDVFEHTLCALHQLEKFLAQSLPDTPVDTETAGLLKFAILLHDIGKPSCKTIDESGYVHFYGHEQTGADMAAGICERLRCSNAESRLTDIIIRNHLRPLLLFSNPSPRAITRFFMKFGEHTPMLLYHAIADDRGKGVSEDDGFAKFAHDLMRQFKQRFKPRCEIPPLITGHDLIGIFGLKPSPMFGEILAMIAEEQFSGNIHSKEEALGLIEQYLIKFKIFLKIIAVILPVDLSLA